MEQKEPGHGVPMEQTVILAAAEFGTKFFTSVCHDQRLFEHFPSDVRKRVPPFPYHKLEVPRSPGTPKDPNDDKEIIPLKFQILYAELGVSDKHLDLVRDELRKPDMTGTHTDVIVQQQTAETLDVPLMTVDGVGDIVAVGVDMPSDYPLPVQLAVVPQVMRCLIGRLIKHHGLADMDARKQLKEFSTLRVAIGERERGKPRELVIFASVTSADKAIEASHYVIQTQALHHYRQLFIQPLTTRFANFFKTDHNADYDDPQAFGDDPSPDL
jgi:hypothetical protein